MFFRLVDAISDLLLHTGEGVLLVDMVPLEHVFIGHFAWLALALADVLVPLILHVHLGVRRFLCTDINNVLFNVDTGCMLTSRRPEQEIGLFTDVVLAVIKWILHKGLVVTVGFDALPQFRYLQVVWLSVGLYYYVIFANA